MKTASIYNISVQHMGRRGKRNQMFISFTYEDKEEMVKIRKQKQKRNRCSFPVLAESHRFTGEEMQCDLPDLSAICEPPAVEFFNLNLGAEFGCQGDDWDMVL